MKVLMLTWEFPPYIAGGLGMACYGLVKALLANGAKIDLVLPTSEEVYFPMRRPEDADIMPVKYMNPGRKFRFSAQTIENLEERLKLVGMMAQPESYITPGFSFERITDLVWNTQVVKGITPLDNLKNYLRGDEPIFRKVQELTLRIMRNFQRLKFDIIHAHDWLTYPAALFLKEASGKRLLTHIHATEFDRAGGPGDERIHNIEYSGMSAADTVIAVSQYTARMVIDRYRIRPAKIRVVHNAYSVSDNIVMEKRKLFKDPLVLFLGRVTIQKGPDYFLEVAGRVLKRFPKVRFVMAGSGDMFSRILKSAAARRLKDRFLVSGFLNREQVEKMLAATDIFVLPSVSEPFGIVPLEAMAFGAAVIVSKQSGVSEVVENVFKVDFWDIDKTVDIIVDLLENPEKRENIAMTGRNEVLAIGWQKAAESMLEIYREVA